MGKERDRRGGAGAGESSKPSKQAAEMEERSAEAVEKGGFLQILGKWKRMGGLTAEDVERAVPVPPHKSGTAMFRRTGVKRWARIHLLLQDGFLRLSARPFAGPTTPSPPPSQPLPPTPSLPLSATPTSSELTMDTLSLELGKSVIEFEKRRRKLDITRDRATYHLAFPDAKDMEEWLLNIYFHRVYSQLRSLHPSGLPVPGLPVIAPAASQESHNTIRTALNDVMVQFRRVKQGFLNFSTAYKPKKPLHWLLFGRKAKALTSDVEELKAIAKDMDVLSALLEQLKTQTEGVDREKALADVSQEGVFLVRAGSGDDNAGTALSISTRLSKSPTGPESADSDSFGDTDVDSDKVMDDDDDEEVGWFRSPKTPSPLPTKTPSAQTPKKTPSKQPPATPKSKEKDKKKESPLQKPPPDVMVHRKTSPDPAMGAVGKAVESKGGTPKNAKDKSKESSLRKPSPDPAIGAVTGSGTGSGAKKDGRKAKVRRTTLPAKMPPPISMSFGMAMKALTENRFPLNLFEPVGALQRQVERLDYAELVDKAMGEKEAVARMGWVAGFALAGLAVNHHRTGKPFTPLLGETYAMDRWEELGWRFHSEQVSHNPDVSASCCEGRREWRLDVVIDLGKPKISSLTCVSVKPNGLFQLFLYGGVGETYRWRPLEARIYNPSSPHKRSLFFLGKLEVSCSNGLVARLNLDGSTTAVKGSVLKSAGSGKPVGTLEGRWDGSVEVKTGEVKRTVLSFKGLPPDEAAYYGLSLFARQVNEEGVEERLPPTDTRKRPDQRAFEEGRLQVAQGLKERLEEAQRRRRAAKASAPVRWFQDNAANNALAWSSNRLYWDAAATHFKRCPPILDIFALT